MLNGIPNQHSDNLILLNRSQRAETPITALIRMKDLETMRRSHLPQSFPKVALLSLLLYGASISGLPGSFNARVAAQSATGSTNSALSMTSESLSMSNATGLPTDRSGSPVSGSEQYGSIDASPLAATTGERSVLDSSDIYVDSTIARMQQTDRLKQSNRNAATAMASVLPRNELTDASADVIRNPAASRRGMENVLLPNPRSGLQSDYRAVSDGESTCTRLSGRVTQIGRDYTNQMIRSPRQTAVANLGLLFPLSIPAAITSAFGWRVHPLTGDRRFHSGTDLGAPLGTPVLAACAGKVAIADFLGGYGLAVTLTHNQGAQETLYGHLSAILVKPGEWVERGTTIGLLGSTGVSTGPHLHFELQQRTEDGWVAIDPGEQLEYALAQLIQRMQIAQTKTNVGT